jgi:hypothetical protein
MPARRRYSQQARLDARSARAARESAQPQPREQPYLRPIPGRRSAAATRPRLSPLLKTGIVMAMVALVVVMLVSISRVVLINLTAEASVRAEELSAEIAAAQAEGLKLEIQHALAASSTSIQKQATQLGMVPATSEALPAATSLSPAARAATDAAIERRQAEQAAAAESLAAHQRAAEAAAAAAQRAAENAAAQENAAAAESAAAAENAEAARGTQNG